MTKLKYRIFAGIAILVAAVFLYLALRLGFIAVVFTVLGFVLGVIYCRVKDMYTACKLMFTNKKHGKSKTEDE